MHSGLQCLFLLKILLKYIIDLLLVFWAYCFIMQFLKDPRLSSYRSSTTIKKCIPSVQFDQSFAKQNAIYNFLKSSQPTVHQKRSILAQKQKSRSLKRKSTLQLTHQRFLQHKASQRLSNINQFFQVKQTPSNKIKNQFQQKVSPQIQHKDMIKLNEFTMAVEQFQKQINQDRQRVRILKEFKNKMENHFERFKLDEDQTRKQIMDHEEIIRFLLTKNTDDDNIAYFKVVQDKKLLENKNRVKSSMQNKKHQENKNFSLILQEISKIDQYQQRCEERVSQAIESIKRSNSLRGKLILSNQSNKSLKKSSFTSFRAYKDKETLFCNQLKHTLKNKQNQNSIDKKTKAVDQALHQNTRPQSGTIKQTRITKIKHQPFFQKKTTSGPLKLSGFCAQIDPTHSLKDQDVTVYKPQNQTSYGSPKRQQKRIKTAGNSNSRNIFYNPSRFYQYNSY